MIDDTDDATDRSLKQLLSRATRVVEPLEPDPVAAVQQRVARRQARHRRAAVAIAAAIALVAAGIAFTVDRGTHDVTVVVSPSSTAERKESTTNSSSSVPTTAPATTGVPSRGGTPLALRADVALAWTGSEVVVWGGDIEAANMGLPGPDRMFADGAAFNPATRLWRKMSPGPLPAGAGRPFAAMTDAGVVIVQGTATAIWNPDANTWRALDDAPSPVTDLVADRGRVLSNTANAVLDVKGGTWRTMPAPPLRLERPTTVWTGRALIVIGGPNTPSTSAAAMALDPNKGRWRTLALPPAELHAEALSAAWDGHRVVVANYDMTAATYDLTTDTWNRLPSVPARFYESTPETISTGGTTIVTMAQAIAVLRNGDQWEPVPRTVIPTGQTVLLGAPATNSRARSAIWSTDTKARTNALTIVNMATLLASTPLRQVGTGSIELGRGEVVTRATYDNPNNIVQTVKLTIQTTASQKCTISSAYLGIAGPTINQPIKEELPGSIGPRTWFHDTAGLDWETKASGSDLFRITCDDPLEAHRLATTADFS